MSDPQAEDCLYDSEAMRRFVGIDLGAEPGPDETTICKFRKVSSGVWTAAGEFESYMGRFTGRALLGVQGTSAYSANLTRREIYSYGGRSAFTTPDYFHDIVSATFYPLDDLALTVGHVYSFGRNAVTGEVEYLLPQFRGGNIAPSAFVSAAYGWNNASNIMAGIRVYFGNHDKTLIRRQREDDPVTAVSKARYVKPNCIKLNGPNKNALCESPSVSSYHPPPMDTINTIVTFPVVRP